MIAIRDKSMNETLRQLCLDELQKMLDEVPDGFTCTMQRQNGNVPVPPGPDDEYQPYEYNGEVALVFMVLPVGVKPEVPRLVPG